MACSSRNCDPPAPASSAHAQSNSRFHPAEEWRSWDQLEASPPSPSLPCWDSDDDDESGSSVTGPRPSDLYGKFTWKIENFSQISKRELRSNVFEVGGYKWYILVYPQGCDVCNHLSLFLCVADYDKLLPGWSHFAQFTIAVVNKDPKKSKYSDTLHRFCKKEHDWGWKKFMELSKVLDGFTVADTLVIKAQVQIIRENPHCPFRCLDCQYRRELVRVYLTNVEGICRRFVEEKREKLTKLMEDSVRWSSFRSFWTAVEESVRRRLSMEKSDVILKAVVKRFFNETEVTSTLVMDALHSGCKALNIQSKNKKGKSNGLELEETVKPIVWMDKDVFILAGDVLSLLERAATEPLPPYKDDKGPQNRTKDGSSGDDFGRDSVERDERRLTELGRRTIEMFVLAHLFSRVEVAYREAIALKRQEELIREEEAAGQAEIESKAKREAAEKERRTRKKQAKQRRTSRKERDKEVEAKREAVAQEPQQRDDTANEKVTKAYLLKGHAISSIMIGDDDDELSGLETTDEIMGTLEPPIEDVDVGEAVWEMEGSDMHGGIEASFSGGLCEGSTQNGQSIKNCQQTLLDDGSSTCSSDSFPSISAVSNGSVRGSFTLSDRNHISPSRGRERVDIEGYDKVLRLMESDGMLRVSLDAGCTAEPSSSGSSAGLDPEMVVASLRERVQWLEQRLAEKEQEVVMLREQLRLFPQLCPGRPNQDRFPMEESTDRCQTHRTQDVGPSSSSNVCNGSSESPTSTEVNENKIDPEMTMNRTSMVPGASVNITNEFIRHNDHHPSRPDKQRCDASRCSQIANGNIIAQGKPASSSLPPALSNCSSEVLVSASSINIGAPSSTSTVQVMGFSRSLNAPVLPAAARSSLPVTEIHSAPLSSSVGVVGQLGRTNKEAGGSGNPALIQGPPVMPSYRNAAAGKMRSGNSAPEGGQFISAAASAVTSSCSSQPLPYMNHAFVHIPQHISPSLPCTTGSHSQMLPFPHNMPAVCGQAVPVSTINMKAAEAFEATCTPITTADGEGVMVVDGLGNILNRQSESARLSMGITFGTITPEMFHAQRHQDQQHKCNISGGHAEGYFLNEEGYFLKEDCYLQAHQTDQLLLQQAQEQQIRQGHNYHHQRLIHHDLHPQQSQKYHQMHQQGFPEFGPGNSAVRRTLATVAENVNNGYMMSDEFPHLDIINDLLDEDRNFEKALSALLQQPGNQGLNCLPSFPEPHRMNSGQRRLETCTFHGKCSSECERGITCNDDLLQMHSTEDCISTGLRDTTQVVGPFAHSPLLRSFIHHEESTEEISRHHWQGVNVNMPVSSNANGIDRRGYPLPNHHIPHHIPVAECAATSLDQNGYTTYASMRQL